MTDINSLENAFTAWLNGDSSAADLWSRIDTGKATYKDATEYSKLIGKEWSNLLHDAVGANIPEEELTDIISSGIKKGYSNTAYYTKRVQELVNRRAGISMKSFEPAIDDYRLDNLIDKLKATAELNGLVNAGNEWLIAPEVIENITQSAITDTIEYNARKQSEAGIYAYITRDAGAGCCSWCNGMAGVYEYGDEPADFYRVHKGCTCVITYKPSKSPMQRISFETNSDGKLTKKIVTL